MPFMKKVNGKSVRDYRRQYDKYDGLEETKRNRAKRNAARRELMRQGKVKKGDGKDVAHKRALSKGGANSLANLFVQSSSGNKSFSRNKDGSMKSEKSKKER